MSIRHPGDLTLERYRNHSLKPDEAWKLEGHLKACPLCRSRLEAWAETDKRLAELRPESPSEGFTDKVMQALPPLCGAGSLLQPDAEAPASKARKPLPLRPELTHAMVATAATYLFISSGVLGTVLTLDPGKMEFGFQYRLSLLLEWVDRLAQVIPS